MTISSGVVPHLHNSALIGSQLGSKTNLRFKLKWGFAKTLITARSLLWGLLTFPGATRAWCKETSSSLRTQSPSLRVHSLCSSRSMEEANVTQSISIWTFLFCVSSSQQRVTPSTQIGERSWWWRISLRQSCHRWHWIWSGQTSKGASEIPRIATITAPFHLHPDSRPTSDTSFISFLTTLRPGTQRGCRWSPRTMRNSAFGSLGWTL